MSKRSRSKGEGTNAIPSFPLRILPERLLELSVPCQRCSHQVRPDLFEIGSEPIAPLKPDDAGPLDPGRWVPLGRVLQCPQCGGEAHLAYPVVKMLHRCLLYGDEAFREQGGRHLTTYSLVGADEKAVPEIAGRINTLKAELEPRREPASWRFHMKDLWSGHKRERHPTFRAWDGTKTEYAVNRLFEVVESKLLFKYNVVALGRSTQFKESKRTAYVALLMLVVDELTTKAAQPVLFFDSEKPSQGSRIIHGWARDLFNATQRGLLYPFLAHGIEVPEPCFVTPGSHACLELADFMSFVIARKFFDEWHGREPALDPARLGSVRYLGFDAGGDLVSVRANPEGLARTFS